MTCPRGCGVTYIRSTAKIHDDLCTFFKCVSISPFPQESSLSKAAFGRCRVTGGCQTLTKREHLLKHEMWCKAQSKTLEAESEKLKSQAAELERARERIRELEAEKGVGLIPPPPSPIAAVAEIEPEAPDVKPDISLVSLLLSTMSSSILILFGLVAPCKRGRRGGRRRPATKASQDFKWIRCFLKVRSKIRVGKPYREEGCSPDEESLRMSIQSWSSCYRGCIRFRSS